MGYIHTISVNNQNYLIEPTLFAVTSGTASAITASITNFELIAGITITLQIRTSNGANATLNINNEENSKAIYYQGAPIEANILKQGHIYNLVYDGNIWHVLGEKLASNEMVLPHKLVFGAGGAYEYDGSADITVPVYTGGII